MFNIIKAISLRKSIRNYKNQSVSKEHLEKIKTIINQTKPLFENIPMEVLLIEDGEKIKATFKGFIDKYTKVKAPHYLAFTSEIQEGYLENIGFLGEEIVLKMTKLGLGTCWVGSAIKQEIFKSIVTVKDKQKYVILLAFGYPVEELQPVTSRKRLEKNKIVSGTYEKEYDVIIQALINAPSAVNSQPWKLFVSDNKFDMYLANRNIFTKKMLKDMNHIDIGIGLSHIYHSAIELGYEIDLKSTYHNTEKDSLYIISALLNKY